MRAGLLAASCFVCLNLNGRELGSYHAADEILARDLLLEHALTLDATVAKQPAYAERSGFVKAADGHFRSAFLIVSALEAAVIGRRLVSTGMFYLTGPLSPNLLTKLTASLLSSIAVMFVFLPAPLRDGCRRRLRRGRVRLGKNLWVLASQTLWQHETVLFGVSLALFMLTKEPKDQPPSSQSLGGIKVADLWIASAGLGLAGWAPAQVAATIAVLSLCLITRRGRAT